MITSGTVRKNQCLLSHIHPVHEVQIDDQATSQADEAGTFVAQLIPYHILNLAELEGDNPFPVILGYHLRIIPIGLDIHQPVSGNTEQFRSFRYDNYLVQFEALHKFSEFF